MYEDIEHCKPRAKLDIYFGVSTDYFFYLLVFRKLKHSEPSNFSFLYSVILCHLIGGYGPGGFGTDIGGLGWFSVKCLFSNM